MIRDQHWNHVSLSQSKKTHIIHGGLSRIFRSKGTKLAPKTNLTKFKANSKQSNGSVIKNLPANAGDRGDTGLIPGLERSPGEGNGNPLQYFCLGNPMDRERWWATVHGVSKSRTYSFQFSCSVVSDSLRPHESLHARPPCLSPTPRVHSDSHPSSQWCHPAISSSVVPSPPASNPSQHQRLFQ